MRRTFDKFLRGMTVAISRRGLIRAAAILFLASALLWPAFYNRFPIVFPDTTAYLNVALSKSWTLDRSGFYGLYLKPYFAIDLVLGAWMAVAVQALIIASVLLAATGR